MPSSSEYTTRYHEEEQEDHSVDYKPDHSIDYKPDDPRTWSSEQRRDVLDKHSSDKPMRTLITDQAAEYSGIHYVPDKRAALEEFKAYCGYDFDCSETKALLDNHPLNGHLSAAYSLRDDAAHDLKITIGGHDTQADYVYYNPIPLAQAVLEHASRIEQKLLDSLNQGDADTSTIYMDLLSAAHYMDGTKLAIESDNYDTAAHSIRQLDDIATYISTGQFPPDYETRQNQHTSAQNAADHLQEFNSHAHFDIHYLTFEESAKGATHWSNQVLEYRENFPERFNESRFSFYIKPRLQAYVAAPHPELDDTKQPTVAYAEILSEPYRDHSHPAKEFALEAIRSVLLDTMKDFNYSFAAYREASANTAQLAYTSQVLADYTPELQDHEQRAIHGASGKLAEFNLIHHDEHTAYEWQTQLNETKQTLMDHIQTSNIISRYPEYFPQHKPLAEAEYVHMNAVHFSTPQVVTGEENAFLTDDTQAKVLEFLENLDYLPNHTWIDRRSADRDDIITTARQMALIAHDFDEIVISVAEQPMSFEKREHVLRQMPLYGADL